MGVSVWVMCVCCCVCVCVCERERERGDGACASIRMCMCMWQKSTVLLIVRCLLSPATTTAFLVSVPVSVPVCVLFSPTALLNIILLHRNINIS